MSGFLIYLSLDDYLKDWFVNEQGGQIPVRLNKGSVESKVLEVYLMKRPDNIDPETGNENSLPVMIPEFRNRPAQVYNHLPKYAKSYLQNIIRNRFDIDLWKDLHDFGKITHRQDDLIYAWMEKHGIDLNEKNWNAIAKRYQRQRNIYMNRNRAKKNYFNKKNV